MDPKDRVELIRQGNSLLNEKKLSQAAKLFIEAKYTDGLERIGDMLMDQNQPLVALKYYQMSKSKAKINDIYERMRIALEVILSEDTDNNNRSDE
jgi:hypothetical protein